MNTHHANMIHCHNLSYQVKHKSLLEAVNCQFNEGQISVILGKNGAGKSTLLSLLSKELMPTNGTIFWQNKPLQQLSYAELSEKRGVLPQLQSPAFSLSVQALVELGAEVQQGFTPMSAQQIKQVALTVMKACDVLHLANRDVIKLSGGEQKRAQLARVLAQIWPMNNIDAGLPKPFLGHWLLLDEWTNSLDLYHQQTLATLFKQWAAQGLGIIMVLHDINLCAQVADQVIMLKDAKLLKQGSVEETLNPLNIKEALGLDVQVIKAEGIDHPILLPCSTT
ncbi:ATP-binding cassette domain-containing protein [Thiomicrorhabdus sp.]|uniref:ATP-binding cassette domain-containing protein n=1 Tax=Thiomicrorhabdus sp. TaxID=2039724 RepID=UPI002AA6B341|nr:ATP-binding cassette domain-containing protein [Thiomicrorhabdus sp.]